MYNTLQAIAAYKLILKTGNTYKHCIFSYTSTKKPVDRSKQLSSLSKFYLKNITTLPTHDQAIIAENMNGVGKDVFVFVIDEEGTLSNFIHAPNEKTKSEPILFRVMATYTLPLEKKRTELGLHPCQLYTMPSLNTYGGVLEFLSGQKGIVKLAFWDNTKPIDQTPPLSILDVATLKFSVEIFEDAF
jgi:hypothetical protein